MIKAHSMLDQVTNNCVEKLVDYKIRVSQLLKVNLLVWNNSNSYAGLAPIDKDDENPFLNYDRNFLQDDVNKESEMLFDRKELSEHLLQLLQDLTNCKQKLQDIFEIMLKELIEKKIISTVKFVDDPTGELMIKRADALRIDLIYNIDVMNMKSFSGLLQQNRKHTLGDSKKIIDTGEYMRVFELISYFVDGLIKRQEIMYKLSSKASGLMELTSESLKNWWGEE
ncbi:1635_t:CDS:2 [Funneliformis mosseae]|uniref:1635_t:CDS:1 n=1 Tax=Funneliformis mosseae TaxID=27381 RepID=A0A9N9GN72_FUNMO|nr:1635_t:CDS:2 [Funneliformis mosseae]